MYAFQSESTLYNWLKVKELFAWNRRDVWGLSDCNVCRTHTHLIRKWALKPFSQSAQNAWVLNDLAKWLSVPLQTKWLWVRLPLQSLKWSYLCSSCCQYFPFYSVSVSSGFAHNLWKPWPLLLKATKWIYQDCFAMWRYRHVLRDLIEAYQKVSIFALQTWTVSFVLWTYKKDISKKYQ